MEWLTANKDLLILVLQIVWGLLSVVIGLYIKGEKNWAKALQLAVDGAKQLAEDAISGTTEEVVKEVAGDVYDLWLVKTFVGKIFTKERFQNAAWMLWQQGEDLTAISATRLAGMGMLELQQ